MIYNTDRFAGQNPSEFEHDLIDQSSYTTLMTEIYTSEDEEETTNLYSYLPALKKNVTKLGQGRKTFRSASLKSDKKVRDENEINNTTIKEKTLANQT